MKAIGLAGLALAALLAGAAALAQGTASAPTDSSAAPSLQSYGEREKACSAWTDGCRSCRRDADGTVGCSNIGIACQPAEIRCTARRENAK